MLIFADKYIDSHEFFRVSSIEDIKKSKPNSILLLNEFKKPFDLAKFCSKEQLEYAIFAKKLLDAIYANALNARYVIAEFNLAKELQKVANEYLWDTKILVPVSSEDELEKVALEFIDGAVFLP